MTKEKKEKNKKKQKKAAVLASVVGDVGVSEDPKLAEYLDAMKPRSATKIWANSELPSNQS